MFESRDLGGDNHAVGAAKREVTSAGRASCSHCRAPGLFPDSEAAPARRAEPDLRPCGGYLHRMRVSNP